MRRCDPEGDRRRRRCSPCSWRRAATTTCADRCRRSTAPRRSPACRRRSRSSATPTPSRTSSRPTSSMACSASATRTRRIACGRWNSSAASATAACRKCSARRRCRRIGFSAPSASAAPRARRGRRRPTGRSSRSNAYVAGVNAFIATHHGAGLPPEFTLLRFEPEPWTGADVLVWVKMMAWDLSANYSFELLRHDLIAAVGAERMAQLMPPYPVDGLSILTGSGRPGGSGGPGGSARDTVARRRPARQQAADASARRSLSSLSAGDPAVRDFLLGGARTEGLGSNNWVVDGTLTASGKPLLANDPHLGTRLPSTWYLAHISAGDFDVIGGTLPGHAGGRARAQPIHRLGRDQRRRRRPGSLSRAARRRRHARGVPRRAGADHRDPRNDRRQGRRAGAR